MDVFTQFPVAIPLRDKSTEEVQKAFFRHLLTIFGLPLRLMANRGKEFYSKTFQRLCDYLKVKKFHTRPWHPEGNGHIKRFHRYLGTAITAFASNNKGDWEDYLQSALFCISHCYDR